MFKLTRFFTQSLLYLFFSTALIFSPYWLVLATWPERIVALGLIIFTGLIWSYISAGQPSVKLNRGELISLSILALIILLLNFRALNYNIPLLGDEDYHIGRTLMLGLYLFDTLKTPQFLGIFFSGCIFSYFFLKKWFSFALITFFGIALGFAGIPYLEEAGGIAIKIIPSILDYPFFTKWVTIPFLFLLPIKGLTMEIFYRLPVFLMIILLAWGVYLFSREKNSNLTAILHGLLIAILPVTWYYSSIMYIDVFAFVLMVISLLYGKEILSLPLNVLKQKPYWYALILIGLIKETTLPFIILMVAARIFTQWLYRKSLKTFVLESLFFGIAAALPLFVYLKIRLANPIEDVRDFGSHYENLVNIKLILQVAYNYWRVLPATVLMLIPGIFVCLKQKKIEVLLLSLATFFGYIVFFAIDSAEWVGYSRFALFYGSGLITLMIIALKELPYSKYISIAIIIWLLFLTPVNMDGSKPNNSLGHIEEVYLPINKVCLFLKNKPGHTLLIGNDYPYRIEFYTRKYKLGFKIKDFPDFIDAEDYDKIKIHAYKIRLQNEINKASYQNIVCFNEKTLKEHEPFFKKQKYQLVTTLKNDAGHKAFIFSRK